MTNKKFFIAASISVIVASLTLSGCGRHGALEAPSRSKPDGRGSLEDAVIGHNSTSSQASEKPDRPFILDGLI